MQLLHKKDKKLYEIYDITYNGITPYFLIYKDRSWVNECSIYFTPDYEPVFNRGEDTYLADGELLK